MATLIEKPPCSSPDSYRDRSSFATGHPEVKSPAKKGGAFLLQG
jgi:hypothetical protein